jgi:hypothetical protein
LHQRRRLSWSSLWSTPPSTTSNSEEEGGEAVAPPSEGKGAETFEFQAEVSKEK